MVSNEKNAEREMLNSLYGIQGKYIDTDSAYPHAAHSGSKILTLSDLIATGLLAILDARFISASMRTWLPFEKLDCDLDMVITGMCYTDGKLYVRLCKHTKAEYLSKRGEK